MALSCALSLKIFLLHCLSKKFLQIPSVLRAKAPHLEGGSRRFTVGSENTMAVEKEGGRFLYARARTKSAHH